MVVAGQLGAASQRGSGGGWRCLCLSIELPGFSRRNPALWKAPQRRFGRRGVYGRGTRRCVRAAVRAACTEQVAQLSGGQVAICLSATPKRLLRAPYVTEGYKGVALLSGIDFTFY